MNGQKQDRRMQAIEEMEKELAQPLSHFRRAVTTLAEREMARAARIVRPTEKKIPVWRAAWVYTWVPAAVLVLLLAVGLSLANHNVSPSAANQPSVAQVQQAPPSPQQVSNNALMTEIDEDLTQNAPTPMAPLEISTSNDTQTSSAQAEDTYDVEH